MWQQIFSFGAKERLFESMFQVVQAPLCLTDRNGTIQYANTAFGKLMGYAQEHLLGTSLLSLYSEKNGNDFVEKLFETLYRKKNFSGDVWHKHHDGRTYLHHVDVSEVRNKGSYYLFAHHDLTEYMELQDKYRYLAYHDPLTGVANRMLFEDRLDHAINNAARNGNLLGVIFCDINEFKAHNDDYGHLMGDKILKEVAGRIQSVCRINDTVARFGGDEFIIIVENISHENELRAIAKHILNKVSEPLTEVEINVTLSIGMSVFPHDGLTKESLIENADRRMYRQKMQYHGIIN